MITEYFMVLLGVMLLHYSTVIAVSLSEKKLLPELGLKGILKYYGILACVVLSTLIDLLELSSDTKLEPIVVLAFIGMEGLEILKNARKLKVPIPTDLTRRLNFLKNNEKNKIRGCQSDI